MRTATHDLVIRGGSVFDGTTMLGLQGSVHPFVNSLAGAHHKMLAIGDRVDYEPDPSTSIAAEVARRGVDPDELVYDALLADDGRGFLFFPMHNYVEASLDNVHAMIANPNTLDRGVLAEGYLADLNVIDFAALDLGKPYMAYDLPTGARRLMQEATGYVATIKSGQMIYAGGRPTEALPGRLVRGRQPAPQPTRQPIAA